MLHEHLDSHSFRTVKRAAHRNADKNGFEVCGVIIRSKSGVLVLRRLKNLAQEPAKWKIEGEWLRDIRRELKNTDERLVGTYHSHVGGYAYPGSADLDTYPSAFLLMIYDIVDRRVGMWKPLIRKGKGKLRPVAVTCDSPKWDIDEATVYAHEVKEKFKRKERRNHVQSLESLPTAG